MTKLEYLFDSISKSNYWMKHEWVLGLITMINSPTKWPNLNYHLKREEGKLYTYIDGTYVEIVDYKSGKPLFGLVEKITLPTGILSNCKDGTDTTFMRILVNLYTFCFSCGDTIPYQNRELSPRYIENLANQIMVKVNDGETPPKGKISAKQFVKLQRGIDALGSLAPVIVWASSSKSLDGAPGITEYKEKLLKEFKKAGKDINDGVVAHELQSKLQAYDDEYLKGDPAFHGGVSSKTRKSRFKIFSAYGKEAGFGGSDYSPTITNGLKGSVPTTPDEYAVKANTARSGSYSRGDETKNGGTLSDLLARLLFDLNVDEVSCNSTEYRTIKPLVADKKYIGRHTSKGVVIDEDFLINNLGKNIDIRTPLTCKSEGFCKTCVGDRMGSKTKTPAMYSMDISFKVLSSSMSAFHGVTLEVVETDLDEVLS